MSKRNEHLPIKNNERPGLPTSDFNQVWEIIHQGKTRVLQAVNTALIDTYWLVGQYLSRKVADSEWGKGIVKALAGWLTGQSVECKGFSTQNLWRMKQFYEVYQKGTKLPALLRVLSWTHHCILLAQCKTDDERRFYAELCAKSKWSTRELETQIKRAVFDRTMLADQKLSPSVKFLPQNAFFYYRDLQCLVAFENKTGKFEPAQLGQLAYYLEAMDRDYKKPHENPSFGVLLRGKKDDEVVKYALNRIMSPALVADFEHKMISKTMLIQKLHEWKFLLESSQDDITDIEVCA